MRVGELVPTASFSLAGVVYMCCISKQRHHIPISLYHGRNFLICVGCTQVTCILQM